VPNNDASKATPLLQNPTIPVDPGRQMTHLKDSEGGHNRVWGAKSSESVLLAD